MGKRENGRAVDALGNPAVDPSANVQALSEAASQRQDDLRESNNRYLEARIGSAEKAMKAQAKHAAAIIALQMERLDKIRQVDVLNASTSADRVAEAVRTLAVQQAAQQETLRNQVATTAQQAAQQRAIDTAEINKRLSALELGSSAGAGRSAGVGSSWGVLLSVIGVIGTLLMIGGVLVTIVVFLNK